MEYRHLGKTGLQVSVIGFGCNRIASRESDPKQIEATLEKAFDSGINFFDTADSYNDGDSERLLGRFFLGRRDKILLCSKIGYRSWLRVLTERWIPRVRTRKATGGSARRKHAPHLRNYSPLILQKGLENSLRRLQTDYLDFFYLHSPSIEVTSDPRVFERLERFKQEGLIRHYGVSFAEATPTEQILEVLQQSGISIVQFQFNPLESVNLPLIVANSSGCALIARQPFQRGAIRNSQPWKEAVDSRKDSRTPVQTILRSVLQQPGIDSVLVGMRSIQHLEENVKASNTPPLSSEELQRLYSDARMH